MTNKTLLGIAFVVGSTSLVHAQPSLTEPTPSLVASTTQEKPDLYIQSGLTAGGDDIVGLYAGYTLEGGYRLNDSPLWVHAMMIAGKGAGVDEPVYNSYLWQLRGGIEARGCLIPAACAVAGVDAGLRHEMLMAEYDNRRATDAIVAPRIGLDIGTRHFRLRPGLEMQLDRTGWAGVGATAAVAYQW
jgi:hypothetical protein